MKIGILGLGSIGARHAENARKLGHDVLGYDTDTTRMSAINQDSAHPSRDAVIAWADAMIVATPTINHYMDAFSCTASKKPVLVEKPICASLDEYHQMETRGFADVPLWVGYNLRFHPCVIIAREWLEAGAIGGLRFGSFVCAQRNTKYVDDLLLNWSHEIDLAMHLLGPIEHLAGSADAVAASIAVVHANARSAIHLNYVTFPPARYFDLVGDGGSIRVDLIDGSAIMSNRDGEDPHFVQAAAFGRSYIEEMKAFVAAVEGNAAALCTGAQALDVARAALGVHR